MTMEQNSGSEYNSTLLSAVRQGRVLAVMAIWAHNRKSRRRSVYNLCSL